MGTHATNRSTSTTSALPGGRRRLQLEVPYFTQLDSASGQGPRMCFSSTCAMAAEYLRPGCLAGSGQQDDHHLRLLQRSGDTTSATAPVRTLKALGIGASFRNNGSLSDLHEQLERGIPCPVGWLHHGSVSAPRGGGHWSLVVGWDPGTEQFLMHDSYGEADLVGGGYVSTRLGSGRLQRYSARNWGRRWIVDGIGSSWWLKLSR